MDQHKLSMKKVKKTEASDSLFSGVMDHKIARGGVSENSPIDGRLAIFLQKLISFGEMAAAEEARVS